MVLKDTKCLICGELFGFSYKKLKNIHKNSDKYTDVFSAWKTECATAMCHVLFGKRIDYLIEYFQNANYCPGCEQIVRDICFTWKQIQSFQSRINNLSRTVASHLNLNYQRLVEKSDHKVVQDRISFLFKTDVPGQIPKYNQEQMLEIIYSAASKTLVSHPATFGKVNLIDYNNSTDNTDSENIFKKDGTLTNSKEIKKEPYFVKEGDFNEVDPDYLSFDEDVSIQADVEDSCITELIDEKKVEDSYSKEFTHEIGGDDIKSEEMSDAKSEDSEFEVPKRKKRKSTLLSNMQLRWQQKNKQTRKIKRPYLYCTEENCRMKFKKEETREIHVLKEHKGEKPYCDKCDLKFSSRDHLIRHMKNAHEKGIVFKPYKCSFCNARYVTAGDLKLHLNNAHKDPTPFQCAFCSEVYQKCVELIKHTKVSHGEPNTCEICDKIFTDPSSLQYHHLKHHKDKKPWLPCPICDRKFALKSWLTCHMQTHNDPDKPLKLRADIIQRTGIRKIRSQKPSNPVKPPKQKTEKTVRVRRKRLDGEKLKQNRKKVSTVKIEQQNNYVCKFCSKIYIKEEEINSHYAEAHQGPNPFSCAFCPEIFSNSVALSKHTKFTHSDGNPLNAIKCETCDRCFNTRSSLYQHRKMHGDPSLLFKCDICSTVFISKRYLNDHLESSHSEERKYICEVCGNTYKSKTCLTKHAITHDESKRKWKCNICEKKFFDRQHCKNHEITHTNMKEFVCQICGKAFNRDCNLNEHLKIHAGLPPRVRQKRNKSADNPQSEDNTA